MYSVSKNFYVQCVPKTFMYRVSQNFYVQGVSKTFMYRVSQKKLIRSRVLIEFWGSSFCSIFTIKVSLEFSIFFPNWKRAFQCKNLLKIVSSEPNITLLQTVLHGTPCRFAQINVHISFHDQTNSYYFSLFSVFTWRRFVIIQARSVNI